jgi:hypothetical protein
LSWIKLICLDQLVGRNSESVFRQFSEPVGAIRCAIAPYGMTA